jgi:hypothetical protein
MTTAESQILILLEAWRLAGTMTADIKNTYQSLDPLSFNVVGDIKGTDKADELVVLGGLGADTVRDGGGGTDIEPAATAGNIPMLSHLDQGEANGEYFLIHHTPADTIDKIDPVEMAKCAAAVAVMAYVVADLPFRLGE